MASGVGVNDECIHNFNEVKLGKKYKYVIFRLSDDNREIIVDHKEPKATWDEFRKALPLNEPRYAIYDIEYSLGESGERKKVILISWCVQ